MLNACEFFRRGSQILRCYLELFTLGGNDIGNFLDFRHWIAVYRQLRVRLVCTLVALDIYKSWSAKLLESFVVLSDCYSSRCRVVRATQASR